MNNTPTSKTLPWTKRPVTIGLVQMHMSEDPGDNLQRACSKIEIAAERGAQIVCLPELFRSPYFAAQERSARDWSEEIPGETGAALAALAKQHKIVLVGGSVFERSGSPGFNTTMIYGPSGELLGTYRKSHIPHDPGFFECNYFAQGDSGYKVFETPYGRIAVLICFDQWFPEAARSAALNGAEIIFYPTAIGNVDSVPPSEGNWQDAWETVQRGHAIANHLVVAAVNRVGYEGESCFWGGSFICDQWGKILTRGGTADEVIVATVDLGLQKYLFDSWRFFQSRRPATYGAITKQV